MLRCHGVARAWFTPAHAGNTSFPRPRATIGTVHPRVRGEQLAKDRHDAGAHRFTPVYTGNTYDPTRDWIINPGSPPHAWGIPGGHRRCRRSCRFTPTCVGNTTSICGRRQPLPVHPHMRGECGSKSSPSFPDRGSPPHAWGIRRADLGSVPLLGFTPTCVGNTKIAAPVCPAIMVHPHMRGEYGPAACSAAIASGSPPHAWGILHPRDQAVDLPLVHPHMRGKYISHRKWPGIPLGSPPHAWGIQEKAPSCASRTRFTPTFVGNILGSGPAGRGSAGFTPTFVGNTHKITSTELSGVGSPSHMRGISCRSRWLASHQIHRRVRGEYGGPQVFSYARARFTPHMRGEHAPPGSAWRALARFTPTHAGNTPRPQKSPRSGEVHPHACGEYFSRRSQQIDDWGSPSRMRGTPHRVRGRQDKRRFTPAHAGNTTGAVAWSLAHPVHPRTCGEHCTTCETASPTYGSPPHMRGTLFPFSRW